MEKISKFLRLFFKRRSGYPQDVQLEVTNLCNFDCAMCPREKLDLEYMDMPVEVARKCFEGLRNPKSITLTGWGEPLMAKYFFEILMLANQMFPNASINFTTNGYLLNGENVERILSANVSRINVSYEGNMQGSGIFTGHKFADKVVSNVKSLVAAKSGRRLPAIGFQVVLSSDDFARLEDIIKEAKELGLDFVNLMRLDKSISPELGRPSFEIEQELIRKAISLGRKFDIKVFSINYKSALLQIATHDDKLCPRTDNFIYLDVSGNVLPCCNLRKHRMGNISSMSTQQIWKDHKFDCFFENQYKVCNRCDALSQRQKS
jgi:MoaA/NifB/PqqE/SkfB family radical SAM enzyme